MWLDIIKTFFGALGALFVLCGSVIATCGLVLHGGLSILLGGFFLATVLYEREELRIDRPAQRCVADKTVFEMRKYRDLLTYRYTHKLEA